MKVRRGRTYLIGVERDDAEAALEDRAWEILGRVLLSPPAKRRKGRKTGDAPPPPKRKRRPAPNIKGISAWFPNGHDATSLPVKIDSKSTDKEIAKRIFAVFADSPMTRDLFRYIQQQRDILKIGLNANKFPSTIDRWFRFLLSKEGTRMAGIPTPEHPKRRITLPNGKSSEISPQYYPMSDESIISITESLLREWGIRIKHSVLRQYLVRTRRRIGI